MSSHYSANQYNEAFWAKRLGNWDFGVNHPGTYPRTRCEPTRPICDENGRFLPGVKRSASSSPWGDYQGWIWESSPFGCTCVDRLRNPQEYSMPKSTILVTRQRPNHIQEAKAVANALAPQLFRPRADPQVTAQIIHQPCNNANSNTPNFNSVYS